MFQREPKQAELRDTATLTLGDAGIRVKEMHRLMMAAIIASLLTEVDRLARS